ncbi:MAG: TIGR02647 family protein [Gammaproteobacteria bacterium]|jgi:uncharacterized protein (TIGR02647 family)|nr:TIGR02647 family protein [Gammaproteobacteria bacterium]MBT3488413.1 TIGR02647 family protein [Gammaproteobacteria bacterium]MBT3719655.1 TIGR02647 family protein [Gammaproteobacteria bacterium]MBT3846003.1 TIGR02647 family protein [Gammaproteobacteria bacterium]MBT3892293.1 TIGR02647 family protein [Gammaproteobacteria bacterium]
MIYTEERLAELNVLMQFDLNSTQEGIKVHSSANPELIQAAERLHSKGIISQADGGYLTSLGVECAEKAQSLYNVLS